jgi:glycosyltransferase involved in cell wall biosynthesis
VGWDFEKNAYRLKVKESFQKNINSCNKIIFNSHFTKKLLSQAWRGFTEIPHEVLYLGIDYNSIEKKSCYRTDGQMKVFWNHMWRKDKGFSEAIDIISNLSKEFPNVNFIIGRKEDWDPRGDKGEKKVYSLFLKELANRTINNVDIIDMLETRKYYKFLKKVDLAFSTSFHETFGLGILELESAGVPCVLPRSEVYPEVHSKALLCEREAILNSIRLMIENEDLRTKIGIQSRMNAKKFSIENFVRNLSSVIFKLTS